MKIRKTIEAAIRETTFTEEGVGDEIISHLHEVVGLALSEKAITMGASKIGGKPHLPEGSEWPTEEDGNVALAFLAQINFAEFDTKGKLPAKGLLSLFATCEEMFLEPEVPSAILFSPDTGNLVELDYPSELDETEGQFKELALDLGASFVLVDEDGQIGQFDYDDEQAFDAILELHATACDSHIFGPAHFFDDDLEEYREDGDTLVLRLEGAALERKDDDGSVFCEGAFALFLNAEAASGGDFQKTLVVYEGGT